jgi:hypothetical protein
MELDIFLVKSPFSGEGTLPRKISFGFLLDKDKLSVGQNLT